MAFYCFSSHCVEYRLSDVGSCDFSRRKMTRRLFARFREKTRILIGHDRTCRIGRHCSRRRLGWSKHDITAAAADVCMYTQHNNARTPPRNTARYSRRFFDCAICLRNETMTTECIFWTHYSYRVRLVRDWWSRRPAAGTPPRDSGTCSAWRRWRWRLPPHGWTLYFCNKKKTKTRSWVKT